MRLDDGRREPDGLSEGRFRLRRLATPHVHGSKIDIRAALVGSNPERLFDVGDRAGGILER